MLASHLGRPKGKPNPQFSLRPVADRLAELLGTPVTFADDCIGDDAKRAVDRCTRRAAASCCSRTCGSTRRKKRTTPAFAKALASLADRYVNDAFGAAHRAHASVEGDHACHLQRPAAGLLMEQELQYLGHALESPERPFVAILGGAKVSDKIEVIQNMLGKVDRLIIGGAMAYTFFKSRGVPIGKSLVEDDKLDEARAIEADAKARGVHARAAGRSRRRREARGRRGERSARVGDARDRRPHGRRHRAGDDQGLRGVDRRREDRRLERADGRVRDRRVRGRHQRRRAARSPRCSGTTIIGGGDSIAAVKKAGIADRITHISTGGGASLEFLGGRTLPGVAALRTRWRAGRLEAGSTGSTRSSVDYAHPVHRRQLEDVQDRPRGGRVRQGAARPS